MVDIGKRSAPPKVNVVVCTVPARALRVFLAK